jgi:tetratricopeptide (TPR) repeat protein
MKQDRNLPTRLGAAVAMVLLAGTFATGAAFAVSGGGGSSNTHDCKDGTHWSKSAAKCVPNGSSQLDEDLYEEGRVLALAGHYQEALDALGAVKNKDSMTLTMIGYSKRKMGNIDEGMAFYQKALAIDPDNINTREYLGEGYVAIGRPDLAKVELAKLEVLCGTDCEQYQDLAKAIAGEPEADE